MTALLAAAVQQDAKCDAAKEYVARGYAVVPLHGVENGCCTCHKVGSCRNAGKHPIQAKWTDRALRTPEAVTDFWRSRNGRPTNIGILLTPPLLLVDVDTKNGKPGLQTIHEWSQEIGVDLSTHRIQETPSGGWHCLLRVPSTHDRSLPNRSDVGPGVDVFHRNKQFVVSPSQTAKGRYKNRTTDDVVLPPIEQLPEAPAALLEYLSFCGADACAPGKANAPSVSLSQLGPSTHAVREVVRNIPNGVVVGYDEFVQMAHYIKGACGKLCEEEARAIFSEWAERWEGGDNSAETITEKFDSVRWDRLRSGWPQLLEIARRLGCDKEVLAEAKVAEAQQEFEVCDSVAEWETPTPLPDDSDIRPFPMDSLSSAFRRYVESVAKTQEIPADIPAINLLGAVAGAAQMTYEGIRVHQDYLEPLSLYLISQLHSGEGKTAAVSELRQPFDRAQATMRRRVQPRNAKLTARLELMDQERKAVANEIKAINKQIRDLEFSEGEDAEQKRNQLETKKQKRIELLERLSAEIVRTQVPPEPLLWLTEGTPEAISKHLATQSNLILSGSEGDLIDVFAGQYTPKGTAKLGPLLSAYSGESYSEARMEGLREVRNPRLTVMLTVQPSVIDKMREQPEFASRGLTPRFLYAVPKSLVGSRTWEMTARIDRTCQETYQRLVGTLLGVELDDTLKAAVDLSDITDGAGEPTNLREAGEESGLVRRPHELFLSADAFESYCLYRRAIEPALVDADDALSGFAAWGNKLPGQMLRISAVLHLMEQAESSNKRPWETPIEGGTIERAIKIAEYFRSHMARLFVTRPLLRERLVLTWLREKKRRDFRPRDLFRSLHRQFDEQMNGLETTLARLDELKWIRSCPEITEGRPAQRYLVNPCLWNADEVVAQEHKELAAA